MPPNEIAMEGIKSIRDYFDALGDNPHTMRELKIILVGTAQQAKRL